jgi:hypothetical protein
MRAYHIVDDMVRYAVSIGRTQDMGNMYIDASASYENIQDISSR